MLTLYYADNNYRAICTQGASYCLSIDYYCNYCTSITVWFNLATKSDLRRLWRVVRTAERVIGTTFPTLEELHLSRVSKRAGKITLDPHIKHTPSLNCYRLVDATEL